MKLQKKIDTLEAELDHLKAKRDRLEAQLTMNGLDKAEKHDLQQRIITIGNEITATTNEITAIYGKLPSPQEESKTVRYINEVGEIRTAVVTQAEFARWMTDAHCLVPIDEHGNEELTDARGFRVLDDSKLYRLYHHPLDTKAQLQHLTDIYEHEFGKACKQLLHDDRESLGDSYEVKVATNPTKKGMRPLNEFACRLDPTTEVDFYAKNGTSQVVGMFQLIPPSEAKLKKFFDDQEKLRRAFNCKQSYAILGVALGNSKTLSALSKKFYATLVRSGVGFVKA